MSELLKKQNYGVEVEFTGISRKMAADAVAEIIGTTASRPDHTCYQTRTIQDSQGRKWKVMRDSSINPIRKVGTENTDEYRVEFVTPVLKYEDLDTLQAIIRKFREIGGVPHASCGIHIHVDGANHTATSLRRLVNFMYSRQEIIYDALAVGSRKNRWCLPVCKNLLDTMKKDKNITTDSVEKIWYSPANDGLPFFTRLYMFHTLIEILELPFLPAHCTYPQCSFSACLHILQDRCFLYQYRLSAAYSHHQSHTALRLKFYNMC